jgi:hypothetical protein
MKLLTKKKHIKEILKRMDDESLIQLLKHLEDWEKELEKYAISEMKERGLKLN